MKSHLCRFLEIDCIMNHMKIYSIQIHGCYTRILLRKATRSFPGLSHHIDIAVIGPAKSATKMKQSLSNVDWSNHGIRMDPIDTSTRWPFEGRAFTATYDAITRIEINYLPWQKESKLGSFCSAYSEMQAVSFQMHFKNRFVIFNQSRDSKWSHDLSYMEKASTLEPQTSLPRMPW